MAETLDSKPYNIESTITHVKSLAFNRSAESVGESKAVFYIQQELKKKEIESKIEYFTFSGPKTLLTRIIYIIIFSYLILSRLIVLLLICLAIKFFFPTERTFSLVKREKSKNLIAKIPAKRQVSKRPVIIFSAHYDTFSANLPYKLQNVLIFIFRIIFIPYLVLTFGFSIWFVVDVFSGSVNQSLIISLVIYSSIIQFSLILLIFILIYNNKKSTGSIDNASGVSILIELAKLIIENPLQNMDVLFLWSGAEEWGCLGSQNFIERHTKELKINYNLNNSFNINLDMVGSYIGLLTGYGIFRKKKINDTLNESLEASANKLEIPLSTFNSMINPKTDHKTFLYFSKTTKSLFQVACFHSYKDSKYIHSSEDTPDKCSQAVLNGCLDICYETIKLIDSMMN